jgi:cytidine deaminase
VGRETPETPGELGSPATSVVPDWARLRQAADDVATRAYAPYSRVTVGAAGLCEDGQVVAACNVENASYGLTLCAECGLVSALVAGGHGRLVAVSVTTGDGMPLSPCGRCRQLLWERGGPGLLVDRGPGASPQRLEELLPGAFDRADLSTRRTAAPTEGSRLPGMPTDQP